MAKCSKSSERVRIAVFIGCGLGLAAFYGVLYAIGRLDNDEVPLLFTSLGMLAATYAATSASSRGGCCLFKKRRKPVPAAASFGDDPDAN